MRRLILLVVALIVGLATAYFIPKPLPELSRAEFMAEVRAGHVSRIEIEDQQVITGVSTARGAFRTGFDKSGDAGLPDQLRSLGVEVRVTRSALGLI